MSHAYPMMLNVAGRTVVVIGGGKVAARKAKTLLEAGAIVRCIAPEFCDDLPQGLQRVQEKYSPSHLAGAMIVFAATDNPQVNDAIVRDAHQLNLLVNRADTDEQNAGDFTTPAAHHCGPLTITVSAGSPALAALIRDRIARKCDPRWEQLASVMQRLRSLVKAGGLSIEQRKQIFRELASDEALDIVGNAGPLNLLQWLYQRHPELGTCPQSL